MLPPMRPAPGLLVSVRSSEEAAAALAGGAHVIDIKEPAHGSLGRADDQTVSAVLACVAGRRPVSAALGELVDYDGTRVVGYGWRVAGAGFANHQSPVTRPPLRVVGDGWRVAGTEFAHHQSPVTGPPWRR